MKDKLKNKYLFFVIIFFIIMLKRYTYAQSEVPAVPAVPSIPSIPSINIDFGQKEGEKKVDPTLQLLFLVTIIGLVPSLLIMMTSFTRIIIALHFLRSALGTQQMPPNQLLLGLGLFLTLFVMGPIFTDINDNALKPYSSGEISQVQFVEKAMKPLREFMFSQVDDKDVALFLELSDKKFTTKEDVANTILIPAFIIGEITKGFIFGIIVYIPFIVIDMVVASILMAMGMMMLPPSMISLPFKLVIFILAGGFNIIVENLIKTF